MIAKVHSCSWLGIDAILVEAKVALSAGLPYLATVGLPAENAPEAAVTDGIQALPVPHLSDVVEFLRGQRTIEPERHDPTALWESAGKDEIDFEEVKGQELSKRGLEVTAAGAHNVLTIGPPGSGKTMLAQRMAGILPLLSFEEALGTSKIFSVAGLLRDRPLMVQRRYRSRISGPILDRIGLHLEVPAVRYEDLRSTAPTESFRRHSRTCDRGP